MATRELLTPTLLTPAQRIQFTEIPDDLGDRELVRHYKLSEETEMVHRPADHMGSGAVPK